MTSTDVDPQPQAGGSEPPDAGAGRSEPDILDQYRFDYPSAVNAVEIFAGDWSSIFPADAGVDSGGFVPLFDDGRLDWMAEQLGGIEGQRVLELGPLEGGHTWALEARLGAAEIVAIEANQRAYLKCLVAKEVMGAARSRFLLGDFNRYMAESGERFDLVVACGVLYHMEEPARHIQLLCSVADSVFVWTHHYDRELVEAAGPNLTRKFTEHVEVDFEGHRHTVHRQEYLEALGWGGFCGAGRTFANWMELDDITALFDRFGFDILATGFEDPGHPHGPALAFVAKRRQPTG